MASNDKSTSGALSAYFADMSSVPVPTSEEELQSFADMAVAEAKMVHILLAVPEFKDTLRSCAVKAEEQLPRKLETKAGLREEVVRFVRFTDPGRQWFQTSMADYSKSKESTPANRSKLRALNARREEIKNRFVSANLRLTVSMAKKYAKFCHHQTLGDLIQEGNLGLLKSVEKFDPARGFRFATYAMWWIRAHIKRAISDKEAPVRIPVHVSDLGSKLNRLDGVHRAETGQAMTPEEMVKETKSTLERITSVLMNRPRSTVWLDAPIGEDDGVMLIDTLVSKVFPTPLEHIFSEELREELLVLLSGLAPFESRIIRHRFGMDDPEQLTLQEVADIYKLSRERIRQVEEKALKKLRNRIAGRNLTEYLAETG